MNSDRLSNYIDVKKGIVVEKDHLCFSDAKDIMELLEASHLGLEGEQILDELKKLATTWLKDCFTSSAINIKEFNVDVERVVHALELPSHWRVPWFGVKWHVKHFQTEKDMDPDLLELAKLNFNITQVKLQREVKELSRYIYVFLATKEYIYIL